MHLSSSKSRAFVRVDLLPVSVPAQPDSALLLSASCTGLRSPEGGASPSKVAWRSVTQAAVRLLRCRENRHQASLNPSSVRTSPSSLRYFGWRNYGVVAAGCPHHITQTATFTATSSMTAPDLL